MSKNNNHLKYLQTKHCKKLNVLYHRIEKTRIFALHFDTCPFDTL